MVAYVLIAVGLLAAGCTGEADSVSNTTAGAVEGELFVDPEGSYEITIRPDWVPDHGSLAVGIELWAIGEAVSGFTSNVNILTQEIPPGTGIEDYLQLSIVGAADILPEFGLIRQGIVTGNDGQILAVWEYEGTPAGRPLRFLGVFGVRNSQAVVATLSAPPEVFESLHMEVEPYFLTLRLTP